MIQLRTELQALEIMRQINRGKQLYTSNKLHSSSANKRSYFQLKGDDSGLKGENAFSGEGFRGHVTFFVLRYSGIIPNYSQSKSNGGNGGNCTVWCLTKRGVSFHSRPDYW